MKIFTIGHSTRSIEDFVKTLKKFGIERLVDVRRFPTSKHHPWFDKNSLEKSLEKEGIEYIHLEALGGFRKIGYREYIKTEDFRKALKKLEELANEKLTVIMCSEFKWWKCHRKYIANELAKDNFEVIHILDEKRIQFHNPLNNFIKEKMKTKIKCDKAF